MSDMDALIRAAAGYPVSSQTPAERQTPEPLTPSQDFDGLIRALSGHAPTAPTEGEEAPFTGFDGGARGGADMPRDPSEEFDQTIRGLLSVARMYSGGDGGWTP